MGWLHELVGSVAPIFWWARRNPVKFSGFREYSKTSLWWFVSLRSFYPLGIGAALPKEPSASRVCSARE